MLSTKIAMVLILFQVTNSDGELETRVGEKYFHEKECIQVIPEIEAFSDLMVERGIFIKYKINCVDYY